MLLGTLRTAGIRIILDNFGTGYSSLYHLRNFKLDAVKIDKRFVTAMGTDAESASIVNALVGLGHGLGMSVIAEGVTTVDQERSLFDRGCATGQGPLFEKPLSTAEAADLFGGSTMHSQLF